MRASGLLIKATAAATILLTTLVLSGGAPAQAPETPAVTTAAAAIQPGDMAVTGFSGTNLATDKIEPGIDPIDRTMIDANGPALRIFDVSNFGGAPAGQLINPPVRLDVPAREIGQVFGLAFDDGTAGGPPNLYAAATSAFGLNIVGAGRAADGKPVRLKAGAPDATFMEGQFGALSSSSPSAIYKVDGTTGALTNFADTAFSGTANSGPGIGGLAYDATSRMLYASDLETGLIHRFGLDYNAADLSQYDHGVAGRRAAELEPIADDGRKADITSPDFKADDPATWGFTQPERRIDALAVHDGRLYYAIAAGPQVWSVSLNGGDFGTDARLELDVKAAQPFPVTGLAFDSSGRMLLAQRGDQKSPYDYGQFVSPGPAQVLRYALEAPDDPATPSRWQPAPEDYAVGLGEDGRMASGGIGLQYGYKPDGAIDLGACDASIALTGDDLRKGDAGAETTAHGVLLGAIDAVRPPTGPAPPPSAVIAFDTRQDQADQRGHVGNVMALRRCEGGGFPPIADAGTFPPVDEGGGGTFPPVDEGTLDPVTPPPVVDPGEIDPVTIEKVGTTPTCSETVPCSFDITVTNTTDAELPGVTISDTLSVAGAPAAGAKLVGTPPAPWSCPPTGGATISCTHPGPIPANGALTPNLSLSFLPGPLGTATEVQNCASLQPVGDVPPPVVPAPVVAEKNSIRVEQTPISPTCSPKGGCEWEVKVTNTGAAPLTGPLIVNNVTFVNGLPLKQTIQSASPPPNLTCEQPGGSNTIRCLNNAATLAPGQPLTLRLAITADDALADATAVENRASVQFAGQDIGTATASIGIVDAVAPVLADDNAPAPACATIPVEQPTPTVAGPLSLLKTGGSCQNNRTCDFTFTVSNTTGAPVTQTVEFDDSITGDDAIFGATTITPAPPAPWSCPKLGQGFKCTANLTIPANSAAPPLKLTFDLGAGIGAVKNVKNCATLKDAPAPSCATVAMDAAPPPVVAAKTLTLTKNPVSEKCSDIGGGCQFVVSITNNGDTDFTNPIAFTDLVSTADGTPLPNADFGTVQAANVGGPDINAPFVCTKGGGALTCATGALAVKIPPKRTITFPMTITPGPTGGATAIKNCAQMHLDNFAEPVCRTMPLVNGPLIRASKATAAQSCFPQCAFGIAIQNVGNTDATGPFIVDDIFTPADSVADLTVIDGEFSCTRAGKQLVCSSFKKVLKPGEFSRGRVLMRASKFVAESENCFEVRPSANFTVDTAAPNKCATVKQTIPDQVGPAPKQVVEPNLVITKTVNNAGGHCEFNRPCTFKIDVRNTGLAPYEGPLEVTDVVSPSVPSAIGMGSGGPFIWTCTTVKNGVGSLIGQNSVTCKFKGGTARIPAKESRSFEVAVTAGATWKGSREIKNCADLIQPDTPVKKACATATLDPFAVAVAKTGDQSCQAGSDCRFELDIFNPGPIPHDDPVTVVDKLSGLSSASIVSITPSAGADPFPCTPAPTTVPFTCTGRMRLEIGEHNKYTMVLRLPSDASAAPFTNCASVGAPAGPAGSGQALDKGPALTATGGEAPKGDGQEACHTVKTTPATPPFALKVSKTGPQSCEPGAACAFDINLANTGKGDHDAPITFTDGVSGAPPMDIVSITPALPCATQPTQVPFKCTSAGNVALPAAARRAFKVTVRVPEGVEKFTNCAIVASGAANDAAGRRSGDAESTSCATVTVATPPPAPAPPRCTGGMILLAEGVCACPPEKIWNGRGCVDGTGGSNPSASNPVCPDSRPVGTPPNCCPEGTRFDGTVCRRPATAPAPPAVCEPPRPVGTPPNCCPSDTRFEDGVCKRFTGGSNNSKDIECPRSRPVGTPPNCCPKGTTFERGACREPAKEKPKVCTGDRPVGTFPNCCPRGMRFENGACRRQQTEPVKCPTGMIGTPPNCCPRGTRFENGKCRGPQTSPPKCPTGMIGTFPNCCPRGTRFENGKCRGPQTSPPQQRPFEKTCPDGTKVFGQFTQCPKDKPQLPLKPRACPPNRPNGTFPNCCPRQMEFRNGQCVDDKCRQGMVGTPPNCACPPGTKLQNDRCRVPAPPKCGPGFGVVNGQCVCSGKKEVIQGQCIDKIQ